MKIHEKLRRADTCACVSVNVYVIIFIGIVKRNLCVAYIETLSNLAVDIENELRIGTDTAHFIASDTKFNGLSLHIVGNFELEMEPNVAIKAAAPIVTCFVRGEFGKWGRCVSFLIVTRADGQVFHGSAVAISVLFENIKIFLDLAILCVHGVPPWFI
jgi:hypothetical protein